MLVFLFGSLLIPCAAKLSHYDGQYFVEPLREVGEWINKVNPATTQTKDYSKVLGLWNASWPTIVKLRLESVAEYGFQESAGPTYNVSKPCVKDVIHLLYGIYQEDSWALRMVDAAGKFPSGLLLGNAQWIGTYGECIGTSSEKSKSQKLYNSTVLGEYCLVNIGDGTSTTDLQKVELHLGICIPQTCSSTDAKALVNTVIGSISPIYATDADCHDNSALPLDSGAAAVITILCVLGVLLLLGTCFDVIRNHRHQLLIVNSDTEHDQDGDDDDDSLLDHGAEQGDQHDIVVQSLGTNGVSSETLLTFSPKQTQPRGCTYHFLIAFSILANAKKILSLEPRETNRNLQALHGIRFLSMSWVILGHTYLFGITSASNPLDYLSLMQRFSFQAILNGALSVDTFFVLGGTLLSYLLLKEIQASDGPRHIGWLKFFFHRFWRLTPLYMMVLAIWATLIKYLGSGPYWPEETDKMCKTNWWTNLLYINNIVRRESMCMGWSWYLANDMQFFLVSSFLVALLYKWALLGGIVIFVFMLASSITTGVITYVEHLPPALPGILQNISLQSQHFNDVYVVPWCRINPYLIGILLGYVLYKSNCKLRLHSALVVLFWCLAAVCNLSVVYGLYNVSRGHYLSRSVNALYASVHRTAWGVGVAWVILACVTGNGGLVNAVLSLKVMQPLSRLTYAAYLVHPIVQFWYILNLKVPLFMSDITMVYLFLGHLVLSYICAFVFSIMFEAPMINLERHFLRDRKNQHQSSPSGAQEQ